MLVVTDDLQPRGKLVLQVLHEPQPPARIPAHVERLTRIRLAGPHVDGEAVAHLERLQRLAGRRRRRIIAHQAAALERLHHLAHLIVGRGGLRGGTLFLGRQILRRNALFLARRSFRRRCRRLRGERIHAGDQEECEKEGGQFHGVSVYREPAWNAKLGTSWCNGSRGLLPAATAFVIRHSSFPSSISPRMTAPAIGIITAAAAFANRRRNRRHGACRRDAIWRAVGCDHGQPLGRQVYFLPQPGVDTASLPHELNHRAFSTRSVR